MQKILNYQQNKLEGELIYYYIKFLESQIDEPISQFCDKMNSIINKPQPETSTPNSNQHDEDLTTLENIFKNYQNPVPQTKNILEDFDVSSNRKWNEAWQDK